MTLQSRQFKFAIEGTARDGQTWATEGSCEGSIIDYSVLANAMRESFQQLTQGKAVFGKPGVGCRGPYDVTKITIEKIRA